MKVLKYLRVFPLLLVGALCVVSCGDDGDDFDGGDEGGDGAHDEAVNLNVPQFKGISGVYTVDDSSTGIKSIELTESGMYVITKEYGYGYAAPQKSVKKGLFGRMQRGLTRNVDTGRQIVGSYTKTADNQYALEGYGTLVVNRYDGNGGFKAFELNLEDGTCVQLSVTRQEMLAETEKTASLCRTWYFTGARVQVYGDEILVFDGSYDARTGEVSVAVDLSDMYDEEEEDTDDGAFEDALRLYERISDVTFSRTGTYLCHYVFAGADPSESYAQSHWRWNDEGAGYLQYYWDNVMDDDWSNEGIVPVRFAGNRMMITESYDDEGLRSVGTVTFESRD